MTICDTIALRLAANAASHPDRVAIDDGGEPLTYRDLDAAVSRVAGYLASTLRPDEGLRGRRPMVGLLTRRARDVSLGSFATARAGLVSIAIDPEAPPDRQAAIVADAGIELVLVGEGLGCAAVDCIEVAEAAAAEPIDDQVSVQPEDLSAVLYTSGSTGVPKGVRFSHRARLAAVAALRHDTVGSGIRACGADLGSVGVAEINQVAPIVRGGTLLPFSVAEHGIAAFPAFLRERQANSLRGVPTLVRNVASLISPADPLVDLRAVMMFGEPVTWQDVALLLPVLAAGARIYNSYACTEAGVMTGYSADAASQQEGTLPAGVPVRGVDILVVDHDDKLVERGVVGQVVALGAGLPDGYWNRPTDSSATFHRLADGTILVRTGDLGLLTEDGCLLTRGRADEVVKIAGHRVELGEVEVALQGIPGVRAAAATARPDRSGDLRLLGYVVPSSGQHLDPAVVRTALARRLPRSMLPDMVMALDELPQLPTGKVDRSALPDRPRFEPAYSGDDLGFEVRRRFAEVLDRPIGEVHPDDDFFDLGGDSLRALHLLVSLEDLTGQRLAPERLMEASTPAAMTESIGSDRHLHPAGCIIPVSGGGERAPLLFVPGANGQPWAARRLAEHLPEDQPVYSAQAPEARGDGESPETVERLAATYVDALRAIDPRGPYHLVGWSAGGSVAFEIAHQLQAVGAEVGVVVLGDSTPPGAPRAVGSTPSIIASLRGGRPLPLTEFREAVITDSRHVVRRIARMVRRGSPAPPPAARSDSLAGRRREVDRWRVRIATSTRELVVPYRPAPLATPAVLLHCQSTDAAEIEGWRRLCPAGLEVHHLATTHKELFNEPALGQVAAIIGACLESAHTSRALDRADVSAP